MLTPQEVADKKFKQAFMGGYDMASVDSFLESVTEDYTALYKESAVLKSKIRVLVEKLEEYRTVDDSMRKALLSAQKMADKTKADAQAEADAVLSSARAEADKTLSLISGQLELEAERLEAARSQTLGFVNGLRELYLRQIDALALIPQMERPEPTARQRREDAASKAAAEIEQSVQATVDEREDIAPKPDEETRVYAAEEDEPARSPEQLAAEAADERMRTFEVVFNSGSIDETGDDMSDIWEQVNDTEVPGPKYDHPDLDSHFGHKQAETQQRKRK